MQKILYYFISKLWTGDFIIVCYFVQQYTIWYKIMQDYLLLIKSWYTAKDNTHCGILIVTVYNNLFVCSWRKMDNSNEGDYTS